MNIKVAAFTVSEKSSNTLQTYLKLLDVTFDRCHAFLNDNIYKSRQRIMSNEQDYLSIINYIFFFKLIIML